MKITQTTQSINQSLSRTECTWGVCTWRVPAGTRRTRAWWRQSPCSWCVPSPPSTSNPPPPARRPPRVSRGHPSHLNPSIGIAEICNALWACWSAIFGKSFPHNNRKQTNSCIEPWAWTPLNHRLTVANVKMEPKVTVRVHLVPSVQYNTFCTFPQINSEYQISISLPPARNFVNERPAWSNYKPNATEVGKLC